MREYGVLLTVHRTLPMAASKNLKILVKFFSLKLQDFSLKNEPLHGRISTMLSNFKEQLIHRDHIKAADSTCEFCENFKNTFFILYNTFSGWFWSNDDGLLRYFLLTLITFYLCSKFPFFTLNMLLSVWIELQKQPN